MSLCGQESVYMIHRIKPSSIRSMCRINPNKGEIRINKALIRPVLTYGVKAWTMNVEIIKRLAVFERKVLRKILGAVRIDDNWKRRYSEICVS